MSTKLRFFDHLCERDIRKMKHYEVTTVIEAITAGVGQVQDYIFKIKKKEKSERTKSQIES